MLSASQRKARATLGAYELHAQGKTNTAPARAAFRNRFLEVQSAELPQAERERRAEMARKAYYARLTFASMMKARKKPAKDDKAGGNGMINLAPGLGPNTLAKAPRTSDEPSH